MNGDFLTELFASKLRAAVLSHLAPRLHQGFSLTELSRILDHPISSLQHECYKLERIGILRSAREGASRRYRMNREHPVWRELTALIVRAIGQEQALVAAMESIDGLETSFIATELPLEPYPDLESQGAIPLVLIGEIPLEEIDAAQARVAALLGLPLSQVEAVFYLPEDWASRVAQRAPYAVWLLDGPRTHLAGTPVDER
jgi:hypothetical protein